MSILSNANELDDCVRVAETPDGVVVSGLPTLDAFDPSVHFDRWLQDIAGEKPTVPEIAETADAEDSQFYIGSFPGSNCEVSFEGLLHFDGYSIGNINSPQGTLVLTQRGRIEADIDVAVAIINGAVTGNINASERVVLDSNARVTGLIRTRALSVRLGAILDGDCVFIDVAENFWADEPPAREQAERLERFAVGVGA
jgi:cytoskeletal protein CcmA (bactofilin family)